MVARLSEMPALWVEDAKAAPGDMIPAGHPARGLALRGQLLLERASTLEDVTARGRGIPGFEGVALEIAPSACRRIDSCFIRDRVFAVIGNDGAMCLRLPTAEADDLIENGLCVRLGKNLVTWPIESAYQLEVSWRILLHAYWNITQYSHKRARRIWSEWVIQH